MNKTKIFPSGIATGAAFCNREDERKYLKECFANNEHIVIVAPRRYGKTSLRTLGKITITFISRLLVA